MAETSKKQTSSKKTSAKGKKDNKKEITTAFLKAVNDDRPLAEIKKLIAREPDLSAKTKEYGHTALALAVFYRKKKVISLLLESGADVNQIVFEKKSVIHFIEEDKDIDIMNLLIDAGSDINSQDNKGRTILMKVVLEDQLNLVKLLLEKGADVSIRDKKGKTAIDIAEEYGRDKMKRMLKKHKNE